MGIVGTPIICDNQFFFVSLHPEKKRAVSSVGLEHYLDRVGVTGSNPVQHTT